MTHKKTHPLMKSVARSVLLLCTYKAMLDNVWWNSELINNPKQVVLLSCNQLNVKQSVLAIWFNSHQLYTNSEWKKHNVTKTQKCYLTILLPSWLSNVISILPEAIKLILIIITRYCSHLFTPETLSSCLSLSLTQSLTKTPKSALLRLALAYPVLST